MKTATKTLTVPIVHLNGTGERGLVDQYMEAYRAIGAAIQSCVNSAPHMRDYYILSDGQNVFDKARDQHYDRLDTLQNLRAEFAGLAVAVQTGGKEISVDVRSTY